MGGGKGMIGPSKNLRPFPPILPTGTDTYTQQDYDGLQHGTLLQSYCTGTYTEVVVLILWCGSTADLLSSENDSYVWALVNFLCAFLSASLSELNKSATTAITDIIVQEKHAID